MQVTLVAESFGGCLGLRCTAMAPELFERMVLVNPATCFANSYGGLLGLVASTNLLSVFPEQLYQASCSSAICKTGTLFNPLRFHWLEASQQKGSHYQNRSRRCPVSC